MFKALMGGVRSSDARSTTSSSKSRSRRRTNSKASSTVSRKSSRGDDRDRGLGDLSAYPSSGSRSKRYAPSAAGESVASSYATADPGISTEHDAIIVERTPRRRDTDEESGRDRYSDIRDSDGRSSRRRDRDRSPSRERERARSERDDRAQLKDDAVESRDRRRERSRTQSGDTYLPPLSTSMPAQPNPPTIYDPHVQQQFPGQFPAFVAEPYRPPNPAGEAADYYGDQGQSVAEQPGVRPQPPSVIPNSQTHLMAASPVANPPPEPSSMGQVGAAADYFAGDAELEGDPAPGRPDHPTAGATSKPSRPSNVTSGISGMAAGAAAGAAAYGAASSFPMPASPTSPPEPVPTTAPYAPPMTSSTTKPPHTHGVGATVGAAAAGAAAGYMLGHHQHHSMSSTDHLSQYTMQNYDESSQHGFGNPGPTINNAPANPAWYAAGAGAALPYAASPLHPHHAAVHHGAPFPSGSLAFQQRQRGPLDKFIDFWRDPEGVGMFEDYTEAIGVCKYCFEPGTSSRDAPRKHHYRPRRSSAERHSGGSRVGKASRYTSSEDEGRRRKKSSRSSWLLPGLLGGMAAKTLFNNKDFEDTYSVRSGRVMTVNDSESVSTTRRSQTSRGVYRRRSQSRDREGRILYSDSKKSQYEDRRHGSRSRSRSSSRNDRHSALRDAALGAAVGSAALAVAKSRDRNRSRSSRSRSRSPRKTKGRKSSTSDSSSFVDISQPARKSVGGGIASFFTASSENRRKRRVKKRRSIFSFNNSSSSSLDADLAFGTGFARKPAGKSNKKSSKKKDHDVDAALLGLGAAATALAATSHGRSRRTGEILAAKETRSRHSDYTSSVTNDEGWEDMDSGDQSSSSVSSALAFGGSALFGSDESQSSDSGTSKWGWRWGSGKDKKKKKRASSSEDRFPTGAALAAGALGTAALASTHDRDSRLPSQGASSSSGSLQHVAPVPTSDPTRFDAINVSSLPPGEPAFVRPGPIPLQQPQPMTLVSQAVYATQGESIPAYSAPVIPPVFPPTSYIPYRPEQSQSVALGFNRPHRRSESFPVFQTEPLEGAPAPGLKRRSTVKDQTSVQFDLTKEQADKERRADRLEQLKREAERANGVQLIDREDEPAVWDDDRRSRRYEDRGYDDRRQEEPKHDRYYKDSEKDKDSSSRIGAAAAGAIGAAAAATVLSGRGSVDESSETSQRRHDERRQQRRAERRRGSEPESAVSSHSKSEPAQETIDDHPTEKRQPELTKPPSPSRGPHKYDDYAEFFAPEELRYSPDAYKRREPASMPTIIEIEPASERQSREVLPPAEEPHPQYRDLPWPVPLLKLIEPTPPQSLSGSVRDAASPVVSARDMPTHEEEENVKPAARQTTGSRVSWGEHETHEYEVPSTSSELESVDHETTRVQEESHSPVLEHRDVPSKHVADDVGADIEFAAALAAATAAAGFDPALVTEDPTYHTRSLPLGSRGGVEFRSPWVEAELDSRIPHGFVEGEVETPEDEKAGLNRVVAEQPLYSEPEPVSRELDNQEPSEPQTRTSIAQEVIDRLNGKQDEGDTSRKARSDTEKSSNSGEKRDESELPAQDSFSMPGGFETEESPSESKRDVDSRDAGGLDRRSVVSAPVSSEYDSSTRPRKSRRDSGDFDDAEDAASASVEPDGTEGKKKRRKRRSKRDSDTFTDSASVTSSPARIGESSEKHKSTDDKDKEKRAGGFFSSIFGSRVSEPVDTKTSSSADRPSSREIQSEVGRREYEESRRRRREERSSRRRSSSGGDKGPRRDEESGSDKENSKARDKDGIDIENYKSSRQRREERRRRRYEDIVESGKPEEYEKDRKISEDNDENQSFLAEGPEMPVQVDDGNRERGASGRVPLAERDVTGLGLDVLEQRPRGRSTSPEASERIVDPAPKSQSRPASPEPNRQEGDNQSQSSRRSSMLRSTESPTAVPLHFRRPPTSPGTNRSASVSAPTAPSPGSPTAPKRRPNSTEFKSSREIRPLWLVERHGPGHGEHEPEEPLPSLPSSKTSSANNSVEDLTALQDERSWEAVDLSHHVHDTRRPSGIDLSQSRGVEHDALGSQQVTPTAATFDQIHPNPPSRKELKYEFHSPSELLQDPTAYGDVQPFDVGDLPSAEGSAVGVKDASAGNEDKVERPAEALPFRPSTPQNNDIAASEDTETTPTQTRTVNAFEGPGFAGVVDAAVAAAVGGGLGTQPDVAISAKEGPVDLPGAVERTDKSIVANDEPAAASVSTPGAPLDFAAVVDAAVAAATNSTGEKPEAAREIEQPQATEKSKDEVAAAASEQQEPGESHLQQSPESTEPVPQAPHADEQEISHPTGNDDSVPRDDKRRDSVATVVPLVEEASHEQGKLDTSAAIPEITGENKELPSETTNKNAGDNDQVQPEEPSVDTDEPSSSSAKKKKKNKKKRQSMDSSTHEPTTLVDDSTANQGEEGKFIVEDARTDAVESSEPALKEQFLTDQPASAEATAAPEQEPVEATVDIEQATEAPGVKALEDEPAPAAPEDTPAEPTVETPAEDQAETTSSKKSKKKKKKKNKGSAPEENTEDPNPTDTPEPSAATSQVIVEEQVEPTVETTQPAEGEPKPTEESTIAVPENTVESEPVPKKMEAPQDPTGEKVQDVPVPGEFPGSPVEADNQAKDLPQSGEEFQAEPTRAQELPESTEITHKIPDMTPSVNPSEPVVSEMMNETASPDVWHDALASSPEQKSAETEQADPKSDEQHNEEKAPESEIQPIDKEQAEISEKPVEADTPALIPVLPAEQQEQSKEPPTPVLDSTSTDKVETVGSSVRNEEPTPTTTESETPLSRKNSKKNKKKNKRKSTAETPVQSEAVDTAEPISSVEGVREPGPETTSTAVEEPQVKSLDEAVDENKGEATDFQKDIKEEPLPEDAAEVATDSQPATADEIHQTAAEDPAPDAVAEIMSESQLATPQDVLKTAPEEPVNEQPKKKGKKKKNRKSVNVSESQPESESEVKTEELPLVEAAETPQPQIRSEVAAAVDSQVPPESSIMEAPAGIGDITPASAAEAIELNLPAGKDEANGGEPHVSEPSEQPNIETVSGPEPDPESVPEAGAIAATGKKGKKNKKKKQSLSLTPDETPASESLTPADAADANTDLPVAPEDSSLETDKEPMREEPIESQPTVEPVAETPDQSTTEEAVSMTSAQKKKAKKDKKKKRQSTSLDETPASESMIEEADAKDVTPEGAQLRSEEPSEPQSLEATLDAIEHVEATTEPSQEQPKEDVSLHPERSSNSDEEFVLVPEHVPYGPNDEDSPRSGSTGFDLTKGNSELEKQPLTQEGVLDANEATPAESPSAAAQPVQEESSPTPALEGGAAIEEPEAAEKDVPEDSPDKTIEHNETPDDSLTAKEAQAEVVSTETTRETDQGGAVPDVEAGSEGLIRDDQPSASSKKKDKKKEKKRQSLALNDEQNPSTKEVLTAEPPSDPVPEPSEVDESAPVPSAPEEQQKSDDAAADKAGQESTAEPPSDPVPEPSEVDETAPVPSAPEEQQKSDDAAADEVGHDPPSDPVPEPSEVDEFAPVPSAPEEQQKSDGAAADEVGQESTAETIQTAQLAEEVQTTTSKKKAKKDKKKRHTLSLDDDRTPSTEEKIDATETVAETAAEPAPPSFASEEPEKIAEAPSNEATREPTADETQTVESTEESQTAKSKKKAKKDKKKRKSVSFEIEEPSTQPSEPDHPVATFGETVTPHEEPKPEDEPSAREGLTEEFQPLETVPASLTQGGTDIDTQPEQPEPNAKATEVTEQQEQVPEPFPGSITEEQAVEETAAPPLADEASQSQEQKVSSETLWSETQEDRVKSVQDAELLGEKTEERAVQPSLEDNESTKTEALTEQAESEPQTPIDEGEQGVGPSKSKKNKKKKKKKDTLEPREDMPVTPPEPSNDEPLESTPVLEQEKAHDTAEPDATVSEPLREEEKPEEEPSGFISAKAKKKGKKDKKRQSKILDSANDAASTAETSADVAEQSPLNTSSGEADGPDAEFAQETSEAVSPEAKSSEPSPETALTPAEDDGKENQSHDTEPYGGNDKDLTWTDHMVSSQVEQQQATPSDRPSQPALEAEPTSVGEAAISSHVEQGENNADKASPAVDDRVEGSGEEGTRAKNEMMAESPEIRDEGLLEIPREEEKGEVSSQREDSIQAETEEQVGESTKAPAEETHKDFMSQEPAPESVPEGGDAATKDQSTDIEVNDPSKPEDVLELENEELPLSTSGKKKKDKKKKKAQQETKTDETLKEPWVDVVQEKSPASQELTDTTLPVAESQADPVAEPSHELSESQRPTETVIDDKGIEETLGLQQEIKLAEDGFEEPPALSRKKSKKDKKRERLAQKAAVESRENESKEEPLATEEHLIPPSDAQPTEPAIPESALALGIPTETTADAGEAELHSSAVQFTAPVEDNIKAIETSEVQTVESLQLHEGASSLGAEAVAEHTPLEIKEETLPSELLQEDEMIENDPGTNKAQVQAEPVNEDENGRVKSLLEPIQSLEAPQQPLERENLLNEDAATAPEVLPAVEKSVADAETATEPIIEEAPLSRKESKKKAKKAKKQAQKQQEKTTTPAPAELGEDSIVETTPTIPGKPGSAENSGDVPEANVSEEQLVPSDAARSQETLEQTPNMNNQIEDALWRDQEKEGNVQAEPSQGAEFRNEQVAEDFTEGQPEPTAAFARKLSKKEKRKARKNSAKDAIDPSDEPELRNPTESIEPSVSTTDQAKTDEDPFLTGAYDKQMTEEVPRSLEAEPGAPEMHQGAGDEDDWPAIDWEKGKVEIQEQTPQSSPEAHAVPFEPGIAEFDESAIPEGLLRRQSLSRRGAWSSPMSKQLMDCESSQQTGADEAGAAPQEGGVVVEPDTVVETEQSAKLNAEPASSQVQEKAMQHLENALAWDQAKGGTEVMPPKQSKIASIFPNLERGSFRRPVPGQELMPVKDSAEDETIDQHADGNCAIQVSEATIPAGEPEESRLQGQQDEKIQEPAATVFTRDLSLEEPMKMQDTSSTPVNLAVDVEIDPSYNVSVISDGPGKETESIEIEWKDNDNTRTLEAETPLYAPLPVHEQKSSLVSHTSPVGMDRDEQILRNDSSCGLRRSPSIHGRHDHPPRTWSLEDSPITKAVTPPLATTSLFGGPAGAPADMGSPPRTPLQTIAEQEPDDRVELASGLRSMVPEHGTPRLEMKPEHVLPRPETPIRKFTDNALARQAWPVSDNDKLQSSADEDAGLAVKKRRPGNEWPAEILKTPDQGMPILRPSSVSSIKSVQSNYSVTGGQRSLRRTSRNTSGDLRAASQAQESHSPQPHDTPQPPQPPPSDLNIERIASSSSYDPVTDKGKRPIRAMPDVYEGWGETPSSPRSPSRPPSIRHRRSMQHLQELEARLDQLISENRLLIAAREAAEDKLRNASVARRKSDHTLNERSADLRDREAEVENLKNSVEWLQKEVTRLTEENEGLTTTNSNLTAAHAKEIEAERESSSRQLDDLRSRYEQLSTEVQNTVRHEIETALARKDNELRRLREELETARDKVSHLQQQIAASLHDNVLVFRDEDYFDAACQKLCGHVQQWVLRFSKHSDHRRCRKLAEIQDEKIADRFDNAILDGYDTDTYLADRVRRRDVFMSVVMTMVWEFVFTRYLFGMDREQRQKLKSLEKQLSEVGPRSAVHRWRAITLTLLSKRPAFARQRENDTEAVALEVFETLSRLLPPPSHVEAQLLESLRKVLRVAVNLSIEMRTQLAEYIMLPPLQPEYDTNGDLARQVYFNASLMNERSGETTSNEELESQQAVVRVVLFPLVVKKGNDTGEGEDEVVVCPAQVLVARPGKDPRASKIFSSDRMSLDGTKSVHSVAPSSTMDISNVI
ncbi:involucrin repeat protein [Aspergillus thermomutatus]|uniref:Involucrin repeat protein n=1 Tax=Aspergillus thermomutatus TaxID=41047 RepID=A0A397I0I9_ASPTH|nr:uncharacterized protein CDV56_109469 [Aspergillus thermomutatus]RHZ67748.1 hypothetical protein CDV56_109469 [Aspergillus thermomutatus]